MKHQQFSNSTNRLLLRITPVLLCFAFLLQVLLTGCASVNRREESIEAILEKENVLIEKVKLERAQPEVSEAVLKSESLKKAEVHLLMALEELLKANEVVTKKLLNQSKKEVKLERHEARGN